MKFKAYHKIKQFKDVVRDISFKAAFMGIGEDGEPIMESSNPKPIITFGGTVKLHGTNAAITYHPHTGLQAQKRSAFLPKDSNPSTHFEFNRFVQNTRKNYFLPLMDNLHSSYCSSEEQITIYGEWSGKGVGISQLEKAFYVVDCKVYNPETDTQRWLDISSWTLSPEEGIYNIHWFPTYEVEIDFNNPGLIQNKLIEITTEVEKECPVAKVLGIDNGVGEEVVWTAYWKGEKFIFKVKGHKHSTSKVKTLAPVDPELIKSINEFVDYAASVNRIEQGIQETEASEKRHMPQLLKWVANDIIAEENDVLESNSLEWKLVAKHVNNRVRQYFFAKIESV